MFSVGVEEDGDHSPHGAAQHNVSILFTIFLFSGSMLCASFVSFFPDGAGYVALFFFTCAINFVLLI